LDDRPNSPEESTGTSTAGPGSVLPTLPSTATGLIGEQLRAMYDGFKAEPIPDRFLELIAKLDGSAKEAR